MFESLRTWCKFPVFIHRYTGTSLSGDPSYADPVEAECYRVDEMRNITDKFGTECTSYATVYLPPEYEIAEEDCISFADGPKCEIRKLGGYFDGNTGNLSIRVVYL